MNLISIFGTVRAFFLQMLPWISVIFPIYILARIAIILLRRKHGISISWKREAGLAIFCLYIIFILSSTVFPVVNVSDSDVNIYYPGGGFGAHNIKDEYINFVPGNILGNIAHSFANYGGLTLWISLLGNLMLFVPFGFMFSLLFKDSVKINLLVGAGFSLLIELYQLYLPRATDIDDLLLNTLGMLVGCLIVKSIRKIKHKKSYS